VVKTKRIYERPAKADGVRLLVMRLWPRGIKRASVDLWLKDLGADLPNLRAYRAGRIGWPEMRRRYLAGLRREPATAALKRLRGLARRRTVTLLCACPDEARCHRGILRAVLRR
jgi:uncharacterized protein YeaO (DUF488 family)